jgi:hypothetical protein
VVEGRDRLGQGKAIRQLGFGDNRRANQTQRTIGRVITMANLDLPVWRLIAASL